MQEDQFLIQYQAFKFFPKTGFSNSPKKLWQMIGRLEEAVLVVLLFSIDDLTATAIQHKLVSILPTASLGAMYVTLDRLERKGMVASRSIPPTQRRGGKAQNVFKVTSVGKKALDEVMQFNTAIWAFAPTKPDRPSFARLRDTGEVNDPR